MPEAPNQSPLAKQKPPDEPAADETIEIDGSGRPLKPSWWQLHHRWYHLSRRQKLIVAGFALLLVSALVVFGLFAKQAVAPDAAQRAAKTKNIISPLTGLPTNRKGAERPVTGIMIENSPEARPQSGLYDAGVVFEAIAEGGITRFVALYQEAEPRYIGPVRSLRPYYIDWAGPFQAGIAHVGGSPEALNRIRREGRDLDQFFNASSYTRVASRASPHNVYTSFQKLDALNKAKGYIKSRFDSWPRKAEAPRKKPLAAKIDFAISSPGYSVRYDYNRQANNYRRSVGGQSHLSTRNANTKTAKILRPKVVIAIVVPYSIASDGQHSEYRTTGRGRAYIFQDGKVIKAKWRKAGVEKMLFFLNKNGGQVKLNPGQTWITAVSAQSDVNWH